MSVWRREGRHVDPPLDWQDPDDNDEAEWIARLSEIAGLSEPAPRTVARREVEGEPPWPRAEPLPPAADVAEAHSLTWTPRYPTDVPDPAGAASSVTPPTGSGTHSGHVAAIRDAIDPQPVPFTATVEPSEALARAAELLPPTFAQLLLTRPLHEIPQLIGEEAPGE